MTLANFPELTKLTKRQRMKLAAEFWFSGVDDTLTVNPSHKKILMNAGLPTSPAK